MSEERNHTHESSGHLDGLVIETSFGSSISPKGGEGLAVVESTPEKAPLPICPRATMELSSSNELLMAIRYAFQEGKEEKGKEEDLVQEQVQGEEKEEDDEKGTPSPNLLENRIDIRALLDKLVEETSMESVVSSPEEATPPVTFWERSQALAEKEEWSKVSALAASETDAAPLEAKYWWIVSQLRLQSLSGSLLTAPLQDLLRRFQQEDALADSRLSSKLLALGQEIFRGRVVEGHGASEVFSLLQELSRCFGDKKSFEEEEHILVSALLKIPEYERSETEQELLTDLQCREVTPKLSVESPEVKNVFLGESSESSLSASSWKLADMSLAKSVRSYAPLVVLFLVGASLSSFMIGWLYEESDVELSLSLSTQIPPSIPQLELPQQEVLNPRLFKGMLLDAGRGVVSSFQRTSSSLRTGARKGRVVVNTTGPIEPVGLLRPASSEARPSSLRTDNYVRNLGKDLINGDSGQNLSVLREVKMYRVRADTAIRSEPSGKGAVLERVEEGTKVRVVEQVGEWLVLTAHDGQPGYILQKDATEVGINRS